MTAFRVLQDKRVAADVAGILRITNSHTAPCGSILLSVHTIGSISSRGGMQCYASLNFCAQCWGHFCQNLLLIDKPCVSADWRNDPTVQAGPDRWLLHKTPVGMPVFRKQRGFFVRLSRQGHNVFTPLHWFEIGLTAKHPKALNNLF